MLIKFHDILTKYSLKPKGIVHIGAHLGEELEDYLADGVDKIMFVEAIKEKADNLRERVKHYPNIIVGCICLSDVEEEITFNITNNGQSSSMLELAEHRKEHPDVFIVEKRKLRTQRYDTLAPYTSLSYDFLNIDVEGAELKVLKGMGELLNNFNAIYCEVSVKELRKGCAQLTEVEAYLSLYGFKLTEKQISGHGWGDALFLRK